MERTYDFDQDPFCIARAHFNVGETFTLTANGEKHRFIAVQNEGLCCTDECGLFDIVNEGGGSFRQCPECKDITFKEIN